MNDAFIRTEAMLGKEAVEKLKKSKVAVEQMAELLNPNT